jgi:hypothetical protein
LWHPAVFGDQAMTVAVVDRLVHHATIFEMNVESYCPPAELVRGAVDPYRRRSGERTSQSYPTDLTRWTSPFFDWGSTSDGGPK